MEELTQWSLELVNDSIDNGMQRKRHPNRKQKLTKNFEAK